MRVVLYDTTLRDGSQREGISFSVDDKLKVAQRLDLLGIHYIEGGWPGSNPKDIAFFERAPALRLAQAIVTAFGTTRRPDVAIEDDDNIRALVTANTSAVTIVGKSWDLHVRRVLDTTPGENLRMIADSVRYLKAMGREVVYDAEHFFDGYGANPAYALRTLAAAAEAGADALVLCDTNGGTLPSTVADVVTAVRRSTTTALGIHAHNDGETAVASSLVAVERGIVHVQGTINSYGETSRWPRRVGGHRSSATIPCRNSRRSAAGHRTAAVPPERRTPMASMADRVTVLDTTLRDGEQSPGAALDVGEKVEIAHALEEMGVDVIEAGFPISSPGDFRAVQRIALEIRHCVVCGLTRANPQDIDSAAEALREAAHPRIHTGLGVSDVHILHKLRSTREAALERGVEAVQYARRFVEDVQYYTEDAGRADPQYLHRVLEAVIAAGATVVNIPDTTGYTSPDEFGALIRGIMENVPNIHRATVSVHCHDDLGMATANTLAGVRNGARQVEVTVNGIGERAGNCSLEEVVMALRTRRDTFGLETGLDTRRIYPVSRLVSHLTGIPVQPNKAIVGSNAFAHSSGIHQDGVLKERSTYEIINPRDVGVPASEIILSARSGRAGLRHHLTELGYTLDGERFEKVYQRFLEVADKKKTVDSRDLEAIVADQAETFCEEAYHLEQVQVCCGDHSIPTATVRIRGPNGELFCDADHGAGPVDAVYRAINRVIGEPNELIEFSIQAVTEGIDAVGRVTIRIQADDPVAEGGVERRVFSGRGSDTDIVVASAKAYMFALNRLIAARREATGARQS